MVMLFLWNIRLVNYFNYNLEHSLGLIANFDIGRINFTLLNDSVRIL